MHIRYFEKRPGAWHLDFKDSAGRRMRPYGGPTEAEARRSASSILAAALQVRPSVPPTVTVPAATGLSLEQAFRRGLQVREKWIAAKARSTLEQTFEQACGPIRDKDCSVLTRDFVRQLRSEWLKEPGKRHGTTLSASTINHRLSLLSVLLEVADLQPHGVKHLSTTGNRRKRRISDAELEAMLDWCAAHPQRLGALALGKLIQVALDTCAREGELLGLSWADVADGCVTFRDTKNGETRTVPLPERSKALLASRRHLPGPFSDLDKRRVTNLWQDMRFSMGLASDTEFVFHTLRHEGLSRLADKGTDAFTIAAIAGHASILTTQVYVKSSLGAMRRAMGINQGAQQ